MKLVIDANIIISALISFAGKTADLLFSDKFELITPEFLLEEIEKHKPEILHKSGLSEVEFDLALSIITSKITFIHSSEFEFFVPKAKLTSPDPNDAEYFALALKYKCPIWSNDKKIKNQDLVEVISTTELLNKFSTTNY